VLQLSIATISASIQISLQLLQCYVCTALWLSLRTLYYNIIIYVQFIRFYTDFIKLFCVCLAKDKGSIRSREESWESVGVDSNIHVFAFEVNYANRSISGVNAKIKRRSGFFGRSRETRCDATSKTRSVNRCSVSASRENGGFTTLQPFLRLFIRLLRYISFLPSVHDVPELLYYRCRPNRKREINRSRKISRLCRNALFHYFALAKLRLKLRWR